MIQFDIKVIGFINIFEKTTRAKVKDCFQEGDTLVFVVQPGEIGKAVGKGGENIRKLGNLFKKQIRVVQYDDDVQKFVLNLLYPLRPETELTEDSLIIKTKDMKEKGKIYGREKTNLKRIQDIINKYHKIKVLVQ